MGQLMVQIVGGSRDGHMLEPRRDEKPEDVLQGLIDDGVTNWKFVVIGQLALFQQQRWDHANILVRARRALQTHRYVKLDSRFFRGWDQLPTFEQVLERATISFRLIKDDSIAVEIETSKNR